MVGGARIQHVTILSFLVVVFSTYIIYAVIYIGIKK